QNLTRETARPGDSSRKPEKGEAEEGTEKIRENFCGGRSREIEMASFLQSLIDPKKNWFARQHMKALTQRLRNYGLRYDDLYDPYYDIDVKEALNRLPREIVDARNQRLKRAMDLSMKHQYLPDNLQAMQTPFRSYLQEMLALVKKERAEREALGALPLYQRTIP
ncbi:Cytochrome b-c1 complex subunit 7-2, partial [Cucurbita argyrosperma subsp. argyrosperma]